MRFFISFEQFLNENYSSPKRAMIYQKLLQRGIYVYPELDKHVADFIIPRLIRTDLNKIKDRIIANLCRMFVQDYIEIIQMDLNEYEDLNDPDTREEAQPQLDKIEFVTGNNLADTKRIKNSVTAEIDDFYIYEHGSYSYKTISILDYLNSPLRNTNETIAWDTISLIDLHAKTEEFHDSIGANAKGKFFSNDIGGTVVHKVSNDLVWVDLLTNSSREEASIMGHCGNDSNATTLYSLRKITMINGQCMIEPLITASIKIKQYEKELSVVILQMKGKANSKSKEEYHPYIVDLLINSNINCVNTYYGYKPELNFHITDLSEELTGKLLAANPVCYDRIYSNAKDVMDSELDKLLKYQCYIDYITSIPEDSLHKIIGKKMDNVLIVYYINRAKNAKGEPLQNNLSIIKYIVDGMDEPKDVYDQNTGDDTEEYKKWFSNIQKLKLKDWGDSLNVSIYSY